MNRTTFILLLLFASSFILKAQEARQGFDDDDKDNWDYTSNILLYAFNNNTDLWQEFSGPNGRINGPHSGSSYLAGRDLDNPHSEAELNDPLPKHILTFDTTNLYGLGGEISFWYNYVNIDKNDYIYYELSYNNGTTWFLSDIDEHIDIFDETQNGKFSSNDWEETSFTVPSGKPYVRMRLVVYQNGNEYLGFDSFELKTSTLSTKKNTIDGFSFSPNPTRDVVNFKTKTILESLVIYNVLGKQVINKKGFAKNMQIDLSNLNSGVYFAKAESNGLFQTVKLIKK